MPPVLLNNNAPGVIVSAAFEIVESAPNVIDNLLAEMLEGDHPDNSILLGTAFSGGIEIQIQLMVTKDIRQFIDDSGCQMYLED